MINPTIRTERTFGVTAALKPAQRRNLLALLNSEVYSDLLDVLEMVCIETETVLINTDPADEEAVLANHKMAKAAWQMFTHAQEKIRSESQVYLQTTEKNRPVPPLSSQEQWIENTLNPTMPEPDDAETLVQEPPQWNMNS